MTGRQGDGAGRRSAPTVDQALLRFDYSGHGASSGDFLAGHHRRLGGGRGARRSMRLTAGKLILVGSSMVWLDRAC